MNILIIEDEFNLADVIASRLKKEKYNDFKTEFEKIAKSKNIQQMIPVINIDGIINSKKINKKTIEEPFDNMIYIAI